MNKTNLKMVMIAAGLIWASNNIEPVKGLLGPRDGGWFS